MAATHGVSPDIGLQFAHPEESATRACSSDMRLALSKHVLHRNGATPERI